jgi:hypothetical protein
VRRLRLSSREAQEIIALEAGYASWAALKVAVTNEPTPAKPTSPTPRLTRAVPVIFVVNVEASAEFFRDTLGFSIDFLHGHPAFYGSVSRDGACTSQIRARACSLLARRTGMDSSPPSSRSRT